MSLRHQPWRGKDQQRPQNRQRYQSRVNDHRVAPSLSIHHILSNLTNASGPPSTCTVSTKRTCIVSVVMTSDWVLLPVPKNLTPCRIVPSVTPQAAKMILSPGARSLV